MFEKVKQLLVDEIHLNEDDITMDAELSNDLHINSIELFELVMVFENQFGIEISDDDAESFVTVGDVVRYLEQI